MINEELEFEKSVIESARAIIKGLKCVKGEKKNAITRSFVRNLLEMSVQTKLYDDFEIRMDYTIARAEPKEDYDILKFQKRFKSEVKRLKEEYKNFKPEMEIVRKLMEYIVMIHTANSNLSEKDDEQKSGDKK